MKARFRIRASGGREYTLGTLDAFARRVHSGEIAPDDLVYDVLTREWAPARSHPAYLLSVDPLVTGTDRHAGEEATDEAAAAAPAATAADDTTAGPDAGREGEGSGTDRQEPDADPTAIALVDVASPSPDEEKRAFIARMEEERLSDPDRSPLENEVSLVDPRSEMVSEIVPEAKVLAAAQPVAGRRRASHWHRPAARIPTRLPYPAQSGRRWGSWAAFSALLCVGLAGTATVAWSALRTNEPFLRGAATLTGTTRAARPVVPAESAIRLGAYEGFLRSVDSIRTDLGVYSVPASWLEGRYLSDPGAYPEVREYWERMASLVETVHDQDARLYRDAYLSAAERGGLSGPMLRLRMAGAVGDFAARKATRDSLYMQVWNLATAALNLHSVVLSLSGRVAYEPLRGPRVSADPIIEAVGTDPDAQARLESALDRVLTALKPLQIGEVSELGARARVAGWLGRGLRSLGSGAS